MNSKPILYTGGNVCAILENRKSMTRRVMKPQPPEDVGQIIGPTMFEPEIYDRNGQAMPGPAHYGVYDEDGEWGTRCPYQPGDLLWVRETWADLRGMGFGKPFAYKADSLRRYILPDGPMVEDLESKRCREDFGVKHKPSIHMPRIASRLTLRVSNVRVERLQDISEEDAKAEGVTIPKALNILANYYGHGTEHRVAFKRLWDSINAKRGYSWESNPWVWVIEWDKVWRENVGAVMERVA